LSLSAGLGVSGFLTEAQRSDILFSKLDATIIKRQSGEQAKYDFFRRLNSYFPRINEGLGGDFGGDFEAAGGVGDAD
jgi:hypothetical protein